MCDPGRTGHSETCHLASRRDGEQDWEAGRGGPRGAGGEDGWQPGEELHRAGAEGAGEPAVSLPQVPGGCLMLQQSNCEYISLYLFMFS